MTNNFQNLSDEKKVELISDGITGVIQIATLVSAIRAARKGNYEKAIYRAILWVGQTNNYRTVLMTRRDKKAGEPATNYNMTFTGVN